VLPHLHLHAIASYFELCYLLVYGLPAYCLTLLYMKHRRVGCERFLSYYLAGTLAAYALFPYFPSRPPRYAFPAVFPAPQNALHHLNLAILKGATIHTGVFPSAHVSSAFAAAWALFAIFPERKRYGAIAFTYAASVALATICGRYHYTADVLAGFAISFLGPAITWLFRQRKVASDTLT
jgi:membrane-associated phospholipid phosphatase